MSYTTPVTDRAQSDITNRTSKGFFNVADWARIYANARLVSSLAEMNLGSAIVFNQISTTPTTSSIPTIDDFNTLIANIERVRAAAFLADAPTGTETEIKDDYEAGASKEIFDYQDVNLWESTLDAIWDFYNGAAIQVCPTLAATLTVTTGNTQVYIDCLDAAGFDVDLQGTAQLIIL